MKSTYLFAIGLSLTLFLTSCEQEEDSITMEVDQLQELEPTKDHLLFLESLKINTRNAILKNITRPDGITTQYLISGDIAVSIESYEDYKSSSNPSNKQYRSQFIVAPEHREIIIRSDVWSYDMRLAIERVVENYNRLENTLKFKIDPYVNDQNADIVIYSNFSTDVGGRAEFPSSDGRPGKWIELDGGLNNLGFNVIKHVIAHEIGHCVGLRHQDFRTLASCGGGNGNGFIALIPGTPAAEDEPSIMIACYDANTATGEFTSSDKLALNTLY